MAKPAWLPESSVLMEEGARDELAPAFTVSNSIAVRLVGAASSNIVSCSQIRPNQDDQRNHEMSEMLKTLRQLFESLDEPSHQDALHRQHIAIVVLLLEVARSDYKLQQRELDRLLQVIRERWCLSDDEAAKLLATATREADQHASLHDHLKLVNARLDYSQRCSLVSSLWEVAWADDEIHHYEEHLIRRLADLMYISHADFIRAKHQAAKKR